MSILDLLSLDCYILTFPKLGARVGDYESCWVGMGYQSTQRSVMVGGLDPPLRITALVIAHPSLVAT